MVPTYQRQRYLNFHDMSYALITEFVKLLVGRIGFPKRRRGHNFDFQLVMFYCLSCMLYLAVIEMMIQLCCDKKKKTTRIRKMKDNTSENY